MRDSVADLDITQDDHVSGSAAARIMLVTYCDFECPYCGRAYPIIKRLRTQLRDELRVVFRHFPLIHKHSLAKQAAEAAEAAAAQGHFWAMHDLLFDHQDALEEEDLRTYAESLSLDLDRFERELQGEVYRKRVKRDMDSGQRHGAMGTPTFFVNGVRHTEEETLERLIRRLMHQIKKA